MNPIYKSQRGAALVISLIMLVVLTLIALTSASTTVMQGRIVSNAQNRSIAINTAESALRDAETNILTLRVRDGFGELPGELSGPGDEPDFFLPGVWDDNVSIEAPNNSHIASTGGVAKTMTTLLGRNANADRALNIYGEGENSISPGVTRFRVTARGLGGDTRAEAIIQSHVGRRVQ